MPQCLSPWHTSGHGNRGPRGRGRGGKGEFYGVKDFKSTRCGNISTGRWKGNRGKIGDEVERRARWGVREERRDKKRRGIRKEWRMARGRRW